MASQPTDFDRELQKATREVSQTQRAVGSLAKEFVRAETAVKGMVAQAGGPAMSTLTGSLQLVGVQLARFFLPTIVAAAEAAQDFAQWLGDLSPETRATITQFAKLAAGAAAVFVAVNVLTNPMVLLAGAVVTAVVALKLLPDVMEWIGEEWRRMRGKTAGIGGSGFWGGLIQGLIGSQGDALFGNKPLPWDKDRKFADMLKDSIQKNLNVDVDKLLGNLNVLGRGGNMEGKTPPKERQRHPFLFDFSHEYQPRFTAIEEARKQFQIGALKSPLEQELLQLQRQMAKEFIQLAPLERRGWEKIIGGFFGLG